MFDKLLEKYGPEALYNCACFILANKHALQSELELATKMQEAAMYDMHAAMEEKYI